MKLPQRIELYANIQRELDKHRVDEWHSVIPLSKDGAFLLDDIRTIDDTPEGVNGLRLHDTSWLVCNVYTTTANSLLFEDSDYIYSIFAVQSERNENLQLAQITRHDKENYLSWNKKEYA